jgi:hypothetical protein
MRRARVPRATRKVENGDGSAGEIVKRLSMVHRRIPSPPIDACVYCVTSKEIMILAHRPGGE